MDVWLTVQFGCISVYLSSFWVSCIKPFPPTLVFGPVVNHAARHICIRFGHSYDKINIRVFLFQPITSCPNSQGYFDSFIQCAKLPWVKYLVSGIDLFHATGLAFVIVFTHLRIVSTLYACNIIVHGENSLVQPLYSCSTIFYTFAKNPKGIYFACFVQSNQHKKASQHKLMTCLVNIVLQLHITLTAFPAIAMTRPCINPS